MALTGSALMDILHLPKASGVYVVTCMVTGKRYIGSSKNIRVRVRNHREKLRRGVHPNAHFQNAWDLYGETQFKAEVLEHCAPECVLDREQSYLDTLRTWEHDKGFNNAHKAIKAGTTYTMPPHTTENLKRYLAEHREERTAKAIERQGRSFRLMAPDGTIHEGRGVRAFARKHGLNRANVQGVLDGRSQWCKGWCVPETNRRERVFIAPDGTIHIIPWFAMKKFCIDYNLSYSSMNRLSRGVMQQGHHRGWQRGEASLIS